MTLSETLCPGNPDLSNVNRNEEGIQKGEVGGEGVTLFLTSYEFLLFPSLFYCEGTHEVRYLKVQSDS